MPLRLSYFIMGETLQHFAALVLADETSALRLTGRIQPKNLKLKLWRKKKTNHRIPKNKHSLI